LRIHLPAHELKAKPTENADRDYIYCSKELIALSSSSSLKEKRRRANTFERRYSPKVTVFSPETWSAWLQRACISVAEGWAHENSIKVGSNDGDSECLRDHRFTLNLLNHFADHPNLRGVLVEVEGQPVALALIEEEHGGQTLLSHVEKALLEVSQDSAFQRGIYPFLLRTYLKELRADVFEFVNRESDDGVPGLRVSKNLYKPSEWRRKFIISHSQE
jgi:hypothetical protein